MKAIVWLKNFWQNNSVFRTIITVICYIGLPCLLFYVVSVLEDKKEEKISDWTEYYEKKYFVSIYEQLAKANDSLEPYEIAQTSNSIIEDISGKYNVSELAKIPNDSLLKIAAEWSEFTIQDGEDSYTIKITIPNLQLNELKSWKENAK